jgi:hypothetical protein
MHFPMQREPVQRPLAGQPFVNQSKDSAVVLASDRHASAMRPGEYGVQPSFSWTSLLPILATALL